LVDRVGEFARGQEQIFFEAPVEEDADARVAADGAEEGELADLGVGRLGGGDDAVLGVAIDEDVDLVAREGAGRDVAAGEQDVAMRAAVEIESGHGGADDGKRVTLANERHVADHGQARGDWGVYSPQMIFRRVFPCRGTSVGQRSRRHRELVRPPNPAG